MGAPFDPPPSSWDVRGLIISSVNYTQFIPSGSWKWHQLPGLKTGTELLTYSGNVSLLAFVSLTQDQTQ